MIFIFFGCIQIIVPAKSIVEDLKAEEGNTKKILENVRYRVGWEKYQRSQKEKEDAEVNLFQISFIDGVNSVNIALFYFLMLCLSFLQN